MVDCLVVAQSAVESESEDEKNLKINRKLFS